MAHIEEILVNGVLTRVNRLDSTAQEVDDAVSAATNAVPLDGSKAMTGELTVTHPTSRGLLSVKDARYERKAQIEQNTDIAWFNNLLDSNNFSSVVLRPETSTLASRLQLFEKIGGTQSSYNILHTGNKPSGSYTGNGSAAERTINTGGIGYACLIWGWDTNFMLVTYSGCINCVTYDNGNTAVVSSAIKFRNGVLIFNTADGGANANGVTYNYQVL